MNSTQAPDDALSNFLRKIALATHEQAAQTVFEGLQKCFPEGFPFEAFKPTQEHTRRFQLARDRLCQMEGVPESLRDLMQRVQDCIYSALRITPLLSAHLREIVGDTALDISCIDDFISATQLSENQITYTDLCLLIGSDWGGKTGNSIHGAHRDQLHTLETFHTLIHHAGTIKAGPHSSIWGRSHLLSAINQLDHLFKLATEGLLVPPTTENLKRLKDSGEVYYIPVGYCNPAVFFFSLIAIDYRNGGYRLRLLSADNAPILAAGEKMIHYCPEVIWEDVQVDQLTSPILWKPLLEAATLEGIEVASLIEHINDSCLAFNSTHLVPWLSLQLGKRPYSVEISAPEGDWQAVIANYWATTSYSINPKEYNAFNNPPKADLMLSSTGWEIKQTIHHDTLRKFMNLIPMDIFRSKKELLLFKAESRLLLLVSAFLTLQEKRSPPLQRGHFLRLIEQSFGKVTAPIEKLMRLDPSKEQQEAVRILLASLLDLKHRLADLVHSFDRITFAAPRPLYPSTHHVQQLVLTGDYWRPLKYTIFDVLRLNEGVPPLSFHETWSADRLPDLYASLERWYDLLLDAKNKCEPAELMMMAHRNVFSRLPIPSSERTVDTFPDPIPEGLQVGILLILKKMSSLVTAEVFSDQFVPPLFIADMTRVYRFSLELYRHINPAVCQLPVSWFCLHRYLENRHSFHAPGEVKGALEQLAASFKIISPEGHLASSDDFKEIPLFYYAWNKLPKEFKLHIKTLEPNRINAKTTDEVLSIAELSDSVGLRPEDTANGYDDSDQRWLNSFGGQSLLAVKEIAQYYTMAICVTVDAFRKDVNKKDYFDEEILDHLGPEDYLQIGPDLTSDLMENTHRFGLHADETEKQVVAGETSMHQRMVQFNNKKIQEPISDLPVQRVFQWRDQADLIKALPKRNAIRGTYQLHQAASGPASLSLDVLLEYFETRSGLLLSQEYRSYFWAVVRSANVMESACNNEPFLLDRLKFFVYKLYKEDLSKLKESNLNVERLLWLSALSRHVCRLSPLAREKFAPLLSQIMKDFWEFGRETATEIRLAPHLLASCHLLENFEISIPDRARLHLIVGLNPPNDPNEGVLRLEVYEAMQSFAPMIQKALLHGNKRTRQALWNLILASHEEIQQAMSRRPLSMPLETLSKTSAQMNRLQLKQVYLQRWTLHFKKEHERSLTWRENATEKVLQKINESLASLPAIVNGEADNILKKAQQLLCATATSLIIQIGGRMMSVDWEVGRITGAGNKLPVGSRLPVYLRKHPDLSPLGALLRRPVHNTEQNNSVQFQGEDRVTLDISIGAAWLSYGGEMFRLVPPGQYGSMHLPDQLKKDFSIWLNLQEGGECSGVVAAHAADGKPQPTFWIDRTGFIRQIEGNANLRLATTGYYPESELYKRWGLVQDNMLVWLDDNHHVAEIHLPLHNGVGRFTRVIRTTDDKWKMDGLDVHLEETHHTVPAFAGHPVYLVAKNGEGQLLLLLPGADPYEVRNRQESQKHDIDWNQIISQGAEEGIHQYRILATNQVEGLTVADNLLLMLWKLFMGHYEAALTLIQRWIAPPGRAYNKEEQKILEAWLKEHRAKADILEEKHPSAMSLRLFALLRIARHLRDFPPEREEGEKMSKLRAQFFGTRMETYYTRDRILEKLMERGLFGRQMRGTNFIELFTAYDHETAVKILLDGSHKDYLYARSIYQRLNQIPSDRVEGITNITTKISSHEIQHWVHHAEWGKYAFDEIIRQYPTTKQVDVIPVKRLYRNIAPLGLLNYFDKAYTLIKKGPQSEIEKLEYEALIHGIEQLRGQKAKDLCILYMSLYLVYFSEYIFERNIVSWLLLEQAYLAQKKGIELPELPSLQQRFGLLLQGSKSASKEFFQKLEALNGMTIVELYKKYCSEWFKMRELRYFEQRTEYNAPPDSFAEYLKSPWSPLLTSEIERWRHLKAPLQAQNDMKIKAHLPSWNYPQPAHWLKMPYNEEGLQALFHEVSNLLNRVAYEQTKRENALLKDANRLPEDENEKLIALAREAHYVSPLSTDECIGLALIGQRERWLKSCPECSPEDLQIRTLLYLEAALEAAHLRRIQKSVELCLENPSDNERVQNLEELLNTEHRYLPGTVTLPLMAAEYYSDCRLRNSPDQAELIKILTQKSSSVKGCVIQAIMGSGKSKMLAPVWLQMMLGTGLIPMLCVPSSLFRTTLSDLQSMMWNRFGTHVRSFTFDRENCTLESLHALAETLFYARMEPTVFVCTPRDLHALQLMLKERHQVVEEMRGRLQNFTLKWARRQLPPSNYALVKKALSKGDWDAAKKAVPQDSLKPFEQWYTSHTKLEEEFKPLMQESSLLQAILNLLQNEVALLVDEVAAVFDPRNLLSFPIGWQNQANPQAASAACKIYFKWLPQYFEELGLLGNMQSLTNEKTRQNVYFGIAEMAWKEYHELLPDLPHPDTFTAYLLSNRKYGKAMEVYINNMNDGKGVYMKSLAQEMAFLKYALTSGLEGALTTTAHVNYGRSKQDTELYLAIPYECANVPKENTLFRRPWKTVLMSCQYYSQCWKDPNQTAELLGFLQGIDPDSKEQHVLEAATKVWSHRLGNVDLSDMKTMEQLTLELDRARVDPKLAIYGRLLIQIYLQSCVFPSQLKLDPSQLTSTPQDIPHMVTKADAMGGTFGFETTWNPLLKRVPDLSSDEKILSALAEPRNQTCHMIPKGGGETLLAYLESGALQGYMALIDAGAHFKGLSNETVAQRLLHAMKGFDCVLFYDELQSGGARLAVMSASGKKVLEHSDREGVRRALSQMKLTSAFAYYDQARRIGADLELPDGYALVTFSDKVTRDDLLQATMRCRRLLDGRHSVVYLIPGELEGEWIGDRVIHVAKQQQTMAEKKANFHGICEQLRGVVRAIIDKTMRSTADDNMRHQMHQSAQKFLMEGQENDLVKTFGSLQGTVKSWIALRRLGDRLVTQIGRFLPDSQGLVRSSMDSILQWHKERNTLLPDMVREGDELEDAVQEVDLSQDQDRMRLMEEEYERMLGTRNPKKEVEWTHFDLKSIYPVPLGCTSDFEGMPALYSLRKALKERNFSVPFDKNLMISSNLMSTFLGETNCLLTENQKPVHRGLFIKNGGDPIFVLISEGDARQLKDHLIGLGTFDYRGVYLVEPSGVVNQRGWSDDPILNIWKVGLPKERALLLQALLFQGAAMVVDQLPKKEVTVVLKRLTNNEKTNLASLRIFFEAALELRTDDMQHYQRSKKLRALFTTGSR